MIFLNTIIEEISHYCKIAILIYNFFFLSIHNFQTGYCMKCPLQLWKKIHKPAQNGVLFKDFGYSIR